MSIILVPMSWVTIGGVVVLIKAPTAWSETMVALTAMLVLAALDLGGAVVAKEAVTRRSWSLGVVGAVLFLTLFWVYCSSLQYAELAPVTLGWVVILQIGVVLVDRFRYAAPMPAGRWLAIVVLVVAEGYLLLGPGSVTERAQ